MSELGQLQASRCLTNNVSSIEYIQHRADGRRPTQAEHTVDAPGDNVLSRNYSTVSECGNVYDHVSPMDVRVVNEPPLQSIHHTSHLTHLTMSQLTLPIFERSSTQNALFHISQLDNYFTIKSIPKPLQLTLAKRSIQDRTATSWLTAMTGMINTYDELKSKIT
jgi:hypothetical protein